MSKFSIEIASVPDREKLVAEIWLEDNLFCEISNDESLKIDFYKCEQNNQFDYYEFVNIVEKAKEKLLSH